MNRFKLGQVVMTRGAEDLLYTESVEPSRLINWHASGEWGELGPEDRQANEDALSRGGRLLSRYVVYGEPVYVITEADRSVTTILLPNEY